MTKKILYILTLFTLLSCGSETSETIYKTKSGEFASKTGNFIANFPSKPEYSILENQIGTDKFQIHLFRSALGPNKIFSLEYYDYPEYMIKSMTDEQFYSQGVTNFANKMAESFKLESQKPIEQYGLKGQYFVFSLNQNAVEKGIEGHIQGKLFKKGNRIYSITYLGKNNSKIDKYLDSFRLIE